MKTWLGTLALGLLLATPSIARAACPVLDPIGDKTVTAGQLLTFTATATDADAGQTLTFSLINAIPAGAAIDPVTGVFTWTPATGPAASDVTVQVADNATEPCLDSEIIHVIVSAAGGENACPVLAAIGDKTVTEGQLLTFTATATDADAGQTHTFSLINSIPAGAAIDANTGVFTWTPTSTQGPGGYDVTVQVADNASTPCLDSEIIHVSVLDAGAENACPVLAAIGDKTVTEGQLLTFTATATDADAGQTHTFSLINSIPAGAAIDANTGVFTWTPTSTQGPGGYDVTVQVADNASTPCLDSEIIHVSVLDAGAENACPVLAAIGDKTVTEGQLLTFTATATDADAGQTHTFSLINSIPAGAAIDANTGVFTWTPTSTQGPGGYDVTVQVADNASTPCLDSEIIHVSVLDAGAENACPVLAAIGDKTVTEGQLLTFTATATDADAGQTHTFSLINSIPAGAAIDANTGVFTWTPTSTQGPGGYDLTVQVADNASTPCLDSEIIHVSVLDAGAENACPVLAAIGDKTVTEGQLLTFTATATDADAGQTHTFSLINSIPAGAAIDANTGVFTWTPTSTQGPGGYDVTVQVADNASTPCLDSEIIHVSVLDAGDEGADFETTAELIGALNPHRKFLCFRIRQSDAGFDLDDVDMSTLTLTYMEQSIDALGGKTHLGCDGDDGDDNDAVVALLGHGHGNDKDKGNDNDKGNGNGNGDGDGDGNGGDCDADQLHACFSMSDISHLVGSGNLRAGLAASEIHGTLNTGETFVATLGGKHMAELPGNGNHNGLQESPLRLKVRPNPLNPKADISFTLTNAGHVRIALYDLNGRLVKTIIDENRAAGDHTVSWSGASDRNGRVPSGVYFVKVATQQGEAMQRVTVLK